MDLDERVKNIEKFKGNIEKLGKSETADKAKADALKDVDELLKDVKPLAKTRADLEKRIKDAQKLANDVKKFRDDFTKFINEATKTATKVNNCKPDTKGRDFFMLATHISMVGSVAPLDDIPGSS